MVNWKEIRNLHVIKKLNEILNRWYGVEMIYMDSQNKLQSCQAEKDYEFKNHFLKIQIQLLSGQEALSSDIEKGMENLKNSPAKNPFCEGFFKHVKGVLAPIKIAGEYLGTIFVYPFFSEDITDTEKKELEKQLQEAGVKSEDAASAISHMKVLGPQEMEYLKELTDLVSEEITEFHEEISKREEQIYELRSELGSKYRHHSLIGKSKKMQSLYHLLEKISGSEASVFIQGANGTGKELVAKAIHYYSPRKEKIFMAVNCSAFNDNLLDSELFGHIKGAFTGAIKDKKGLFETANGGTLFLDEIGDTSLSMQVKLLRVLQEGTYLPVGATASQKTDVRIIAATNKDVKEMMASGEFREDLYYRINVIHVDIPPLKDRNGDISLLMEHFLKKRCDESGIPLKKFSRKSIEKMLDYHWPGNVRELENEIERLVVLAGEDKTITPDFLSPRILNTALPLQENLSNVTSLPTSGPSYEGINLQGTLREAVEDVEAIMIGEGLKRCGFNKSKLAKELEVSRASLIMKVDKYGLDKRKKAA